MHIQVVLLVLCSTIYVASERFQCQEGIPYKENNCNNCFCSGGNLACTFMACPWARVENCEIGSTFTKDCNKCWCTTDQGTICTNHKC
ncbi:hypothetical protein FQR65_LT06793 [Abscondita terminalis]|nr:hypothetical protein FQR65_LT06793 [Abscondita terminalis]